jgi:hypothetical protein
VNGRDPDYSRAQQPITIGFPSARVVAASASTTGSSKPSTPRASIGSDATSARCSPAAARATCAIPAGGDGEGEATTHTLWWPPGKINGRYLTPLLAALDEETVADHLPHSGGLAVQTDLRREGVAS